MEALIKNKYGLKVKRIKSMQTGAGSDVYYIETSSGKYIFKNITINNMNNPQNEPVILEALETQEVPIAKLIKNLEGEYVWKDRDGKVYHMQEYIEGMTLDLNTAPDWFMKESAKMLGKIHKALELTPQLPIGIGEAFFQYMTPENARESYMRTIEIATTNGDITVCDDLKYRIELLTAINEVSLDLSKFSRKNTHGDYFISQIICGENKINAIIDWTTACVHPVCWEVIRSYTYSDPTCKNGEIDNESFKKYVGEYLKENELSEYDLMMMPYLYFYQLGVCDYYNQYYNSTTINRHIFLYQAQFSTLLLKWFEKNVYKLSQELKRAF